VREGLTGIVDANPKGNILDVPYICNLTSEQVVDRAAVLSSLKANVTERLELFRRGDDKHFDSEANHGLNNLLVSSLEVPIVSRMQNVNCELGVA
jgi:hypothetical protein